MEIKDEVEAIRCLTKATTVNYAPGFYNLGLFHKSTENYNDAAKAFKQAFKIKENYYLARNNYATTLSKIKNYSESINVLEKLVEMKRDYYLAHYNLACCLCLQLQDTTLSLESEKKSVVKILNHLAEAFNDERNIFEARVDKELSYINSYHSSYYPEFDTLCIFHTKKSLEKNNK